MNPHGKTHAPHHIIRDQKGWSFCGKQLPKLQLLRPCHRNTVIVLIRVSSAIPSSIPLLGVFIVCHSWSQKENAKDWQSCKAVAHQCYFFAPYWPLLMSVKTFSRLVTDEYGKKQKQSVQAAILSTVRSGRRNENYIDWSRSRKTSTLNQENSTKETSYF